MLQTASFSVPLPVMPDTGAVDRVCPGAQRCEYKLNDETVVFSWISEFPFLHFESFFCLNAWFFTYHNVESKWSPGLCCANYSSFSSLYTTPDVYLAVNAFGSLKETGTGFLKRLFFSIRNVLCKCPCLWNSTFLLRVAIYNIINPPSSGTRGVPVVKNKQTLLRLCNLWVTFWTGGCVTKTTWLVINLLVSCVFLCLFS